LPGLLAVPEVYPIDVVAVALDEEWDDVERFLRDHDLSNIFLAGTPDLGDTMDVRTLPVTYLVEPGGNLRWRFDGARDWTNARFVRALGRFASGPG